MKRQKDGPPPRTTGPTSGTTPISARTLRGLGEKADATRNEHLALVRRTAMTDASRYDLIPIAEAATLQANGDVEIIDIVVTPGISGRTWMHVDVSVRGNPVNKAGVGEVDAAFWSESAADKFLWPYYEGMRIWSEDYLPRLKAAFKDPMVVGVLHWGESITTTVKDPGALLVIDSPGFVGKHVLTLEEFEALRRR